MKNNNFCYLFILLVMTVGCDKKSKAPASEKEIILKGDSDIFDISLVQLIATPERYHNKKIRVVGYLQLFHESKGLFLHKEDAIYGTGNGFWIDYPQGFYKKDDKLYNKKYVLIEGTFVSESDDQNEYWNGTITNITRTDSIIRH